MKTCFKCKIEKPLDQFYKHKKMPDGHVNKCKDCNKKDVLKNYLSNSKNEEWNEKERIRQREKYKRLGYKTKQKEWDSNKPWKQSSIYKGLSKKFKIEKGLELHHWNYNDEFLKDVLILKTKQHRQSHKYLIFDEKKRMFRTKENVLLDTKVKHFQYLLDCGIFNL